MSAAAIKTLKEQQKILDELRIKRAELRQDHELEIGQLDNAINQAETKVSSLIYYL